MPGELALELHNPDVVVVDLGNLLWRPVLSETRQHRVQIRTVHVPIVNRHLLSPRLVHVLFTGQATDGLAGWASPEGAIRGKSSGKCGQPRFQRGASRSVAWPGWCRRSTANSTRRGPAAAGSPARANTGWAGVDGGGAGWSVGIAARRAANRAANRAEAVAGPGKGPDSLTLSPRQAGNTFG